MRRLPTSLVFLVVAWFCVHQPQGFVAEAIGWMKGATRFSHQQTLAVELRETLAHAALREEGPTRTVAVGDLAPEPTPEAPLPSVTLRKSPLVLVAVLEVLPPRAENSRVDLESFAGTGRTDDVPVPVPRLG